MQGQNAVRIAHSCVGEDHTGEEYQSPAVPLKENEITDGLFHVGPFDSLETT